MERIEEVKLIIQGLNVEIESIESLLKWYKGQELTDKQKHLKNYGIERISTVKNYITYYELEIEVLLKPKK